MIHFQAFFLISTLLIVPFVWFRGGHPERAGVGWLMANYAFTTLVAGWVIDRVRVGIAFGDLALLLAFIVLSLRFSRWWLLVATSGQVLTVAAHIALWLTPTLTLRVNVATRWIFGVLILYALLAGVLERRLAGERPVSPPWRRKAKDAGGSEGENLP